MHPFEHTSATRTEDVPGLLTAAPGVESRIIAGGTDLLTLMKEGLAAPGRLIDIKPLRELRYLTFDTDGTLRIGALTTLADLERDSLVGERLPILVQSMRDAATPQLRAMATVGGNLLQQVRCWYYRGPYECWLKGGEECFARGGQNQYHAIVHHGPCVAVHASDLAPALVALDAEVTIQGAGGTHTQPVADLLAWPTHERRSFTTLGAGQVLTEIRVPPQPQGSRGIYLKMMDRKAWAFALVSVAAQVAIANGRVERARLVLGGVANVPLRVQAAEDLLQGQTFTPELAAQVAERAVEGVTPLPHNGYKVRLAREVARRALLSAAGMEW
jgi:xanthine dehydrogenase YagS FAD-binding subunit